MKAGEDATRAGMHVERLSTVISGVKCCSLTIRYSSPSIRLSLATGRLRPAVAARGRRSAPVSRILSPGASRDRRPSLWDARYRAPRCDVARLDGPSALERALERSCFRWGLPERASPRRSVSSYLTISPLPATPSAPPAVCFCGTFLRVAPTGRYPAPCPVKPGLSSPFRARPPSVLRAGSIARSAYNATGLRTATLNRCGMNPNKALWEKGDFTRIAASMRESGEALVEGLGSQRA